MTLKSWCWQYSNSGADIECVVEPIAVADGRSNKRRKVSATTNTAAHIPCAVAYKVSSSIARYNLPVKWIYGRDCIAEFIDTMKEIRHWADPILSPQAKMNPITPSQRKILNEQTDCHICKKKMTGKKDLDHDHQTG